MPEVTDLGQFHRIAATRLGDVIITTEWWWETRHWLRFATFVVTPLPNNGWVPSVVGMFSHSNRENAETGHQILAEMLREEYVRWPKQ